MQPRSLYLHVPFCARRCPYCDFAVTATRRPPVAAWLDAIAAELAQVRAERGWSSLELDTLYVGGGTPSLLGSEGMAALAARLKRHAGWDPERVEWTAEANPESFTSEVATEWRAAGVNRLSIGIQTFSSAALRWMGRLHGADGAVQAVRTARAAGFDNVSVDLIFALPSHLGRDWTDDLRRALELEPDHVSLYGLTAEPGAALGRWVREGRESMPPEDAYADEYLEAAETLAGAGFEHYEVSNFARRGLASRHNQVYWSDAPYLGLGPSAHSYLPPERWWNLRDWAEYAARVNAGGSVIAEREVVAGDSARMEHYWLGLRTADGLDMRELSASQRDLVETWRDADWARSAEDGRLRLTPAGWLLLDRITLELDSAALDVNATGAPFSVVAGK